MRPVLSDESKLLGTQPTHHYFLVISSESILLTVYLIYLSHMFLFSTYIYLFLSIINNAYTLHVL